MNCWRGRYQLLQAVQRARGQRGIEALVAELVFQLRPRVRPVRQAGCRRCLRAVVLLLKRRAAHGRGLFSTPSYTSHRRALLVARQCLNKGLTIDTRKQILLNDSGLRMAMAYKQVGVY